MTTEAWSKSVMYKLAEANADHRVPPEHRGNARWQMCVDDYMRGALKLANQLEKTKSEWGSKMDVIHKIRELCGVGEITDRSELEKASLAWRQAELDKRGEDFRYKPRTIDAAFQDGALWLLLQLEKAEYPLFGIPAGDLITSQEFAERIAFKQGLARILEKAKELCGK